MFTSSKQYLNICNIFKNQISFSRRKTLQLSFPEEEKLNRCAEWVALLVLNTKENVLLDCSQCTVSNKNRLLKWLFLKCLYFKIFFVGMSEGLDGV